MTTTTITSDADIVAASPLAMQAGDILKITRGVTYTQQLTISQGASAPTTSSPAYITAIGSGAPPKFRGRGTTANTAGLWTEVSTNVWAFDLTAISTSQVKIVLLNNGQICERVGNYLDSGVGTPADLNTFVYDYKTGSPTIHNVLLYSVGNPASVYNDIFIGQYVDSALRIHCSNVIIDSEIQYEKCGVGLFTFANAAETIDNITSNGLVANLCGESALADGTSGGTNTGVFINDSTITDCATTGISGIGSGLSNFIVDGVNVTGCGLGESSGSIYGYNYVNGFNVRNATVRNQYFGRYYTVDGSAYYADLGCNNVVFSNIKAYESEGHLVQFNTGGSLRVSGAIGVNMNKINSGDASRPGFAGANRGFIRIGNSGHVANADIEISNITAVNENTYTLAATETRSFVDIARLTTGDSLKIRNCDVDGYQNIYGYVAGVDSSLIDENTNVFNNQSHVSMRTTDGVYDDATWTSALVTSSRQLNVTTGKDGAYRADPKGIAWKAGVLVDIARTDANGIKLGVKPDIGAYNLSGPRMPART